MREIKFREWDPIRQEAYGKYGLSYGDREDYDDMIAFRFSHTEYMGEDLIKDRVIEQYTGLKDVNGVEIYDGDILKRHNKREFERDDYIGQVIYVDEWAKFVFYVHDGLEFNLYKSDVTDYEIIGNIHEQPELLEDRL
ncbi:YopX family protein [Leuconostoc citreum]|uniref:YopX family protein n=1 Tax=Leuconostoc citreum TaxID=33964 RepID=UPI0021A7CEC3|nr:YopX family protein [Leuconostoc citreum]MCT3071615.1 hypothetical protein [Leuconostoc citreum]